MVSSPTLFLPLQDLVCGKKVALSVAYGASSPGVRAFHKVVCLTRRTQSERL